MRSQKNEYQGVNAHLHSFYQSEGGWSGFHNTHIVHIADELGELLPAGYLVDTEQSLQIREFHPDTGERIRRPEPDVTIYQREVSPETVIARGLALPVLTRSIAETITLTPDLYYVAAVIYKVEENSVLGTPVTRIEVLSPTNKPPRDGYVQYLEKRYTALKSGLCMVEIDYLHEQQSPIKGIPPYPKSPDSFAYHITVSDPHPSFDEGIAKIYGFGVDEAIPLLEIPLEKDDRITLDLNKVYHRTYDSRAAFSQRVDYAQLPLHFDRYSIADQGRIRARMQAVSEVHK